MSARGGTAYGSNQSSALYISKAKRRALDKRDVILALQAAGGRRARWTIKGDLWEFPEWGQYLLVSGWPELDRPALDLLLSQRAPRAPFVGRLDLHERFLAVKERAYAHPVKGAEPVGFDSLKWPVRAWKEEEDSCL